MSNSVWAAVVAAVASVAVPFVIHFLQKDAREEIQKELSILKELNPNSELFPLWEERVEWILMDYAKNDWLRTQYARLYRRYLGLVLVIALRYFIDDNGLLELSSDWQQGFIFIIDITIGVVLVAVLYPGFVALYEESKLIRMAIKRRRYEREIKISEKHIEELSEFLDDHKKKNAEIKATFENLENEYRLPKSPEEEAAQIYNNAIYAVLLRWPREEYLSIFQDGSFPSRFNVNAEAIVKEAYDYMDVWLQKNEPPKFRQKSKNEGSEGP